MDFSDDPDIELALVELKECEEIGCLPGEGIHKERVRKVVISTQKALEAQDLDVKTRMCLPILKEIYGGKK